MGAQITVDVMTEEQIGVELAKTSLYMHALSRPGSLAVIQP